MEEYRGELLAPAGTMDCLKAAIAAGADAVYLGGQRFGARAFAGNFSREELLEGLSLAHLWNRKIYLTVNTLTKQDELSGLCDWIAPFYEAGLDGVIVQDMGVLEKLRKNFPGMELIRPLYLIREKDILRWRDYNDLHFIQCACRFTERCATCGGEKGSKRDEMKELIAELRKRCDTIDMNIFNSVHNLSLIHI